MEQILIDYMTNATWQIPLLAGGAWIFIRFGKFGPRTQHCIWLAVLALAVGLPLRGMRAQLSPVTQTICTDCTLGTSPMAEREALPRAAVVTQFLVADPRLSKEFFTLPRPTLRLSPIVTDWLVGIYFAVLFFFFGLYRILASWRRARRLVMDADLTVLPPQWNAIFQDSGRRLGCRLPQLRKSAEVRSPVIVGVLHSVLLLPEDFEHHSLNEVQAALFHELAHVRRQDYLGNLLCRLAALPVAWHPLTYGVQQRIRRTREMICDDIAARAMDSEIGYAKCLLAMAGRTLRPHDLADAAQAIGLFGDNVLEERIMRLMQKKTTVTIQAKLARIAIGAAAMIFAIAVAASCHVTPTLAQTSAAVVAPAPPAAPTTPPPDMAVAPLPPVAPAPDAAATLAPPLPPARPATDTAEAPIPPAPIAPVALAEQDPAVPQVAPVATVEPVESIPPVVPATVKAKPSLRHDDVIHPHPIKAKDESLVIDSNGVHTLTPKQQAQLDREMDAMNRRIAEATKRFNTPEFKQQMADIAKQQADLQHLDFAQMQRQIDAATAKINSPEFKQQMADIAKQQADSQHMDFAQMQRQIDAATAKINSPEFKQQMEKIQKQMESGAMQRSMQDASKQLKAAEDEMRQEQTK